MTSVHYPNNNNMNPGTPARMRDHELGGVARGLGNAPAWYQQQAAMFQELVSQLADAMKPQLGIRSRIAAERLIWQLGEQKANILINKEGLVFRDHEIFGRRAITGQTTVDVFQTQDAIAPNLTNVDRATLDQNTDLCVGAIRILFGAGAAADRATYGRGIVELDVTGVAGGVTGLNIPQEVQGALVTITTNNLVVIERCPLQRWNTMGDTTRSMAPGTVPCDNPFWIFGGNRVETKIEFAPGNPPPANSNIEVSFIGSRTIRG